MERYTLHDLKSLTEEADRYINEPNKLRACKRRAREVIENLNSEIEGQYLHSPVAVYGIHKKVSFNKRTGFHTYLKDGALEGISDGFIVVDFESDFQNIDTESSSRQSDLLERLKRQRPGRFAVSHLVRLAYLHGYSDDFLLHQAVTTRGFSPAYASEIFMEDDAPIPEDSEILETERIAALSSQSAESQIKHIMQMLSDTDDPLPALIANARKFRSMKPSDQYGLKRLIQDNIEEFVGSQYEFGGGIPVYFGQNPDGSGTGVMSRDDACRVFVIGIDNGPHLQAESKRSSAKLTEESSLYLAGYLVEQDRITDSLVVIPLEHLHGADLTKIEDS